MAFNTLPDGVGPDDCEPDRWEEPDDPDRHYEQRVERDHDDQKADR